MSEIIHLSHGISSLLVGEEKRPVFVIDNFFPSPDTLINFANSANDFVHTRSDYYPGGRTDLPKSYVDFTLTYIRKNILYLMKKPQESSIECPFAMLSIANQDPNTLLPIQTIPHIDTVDPCQWALLHYLCQDNHGGTGFFQHRVTGFESINEQRSKQYLRVLEDEAKVNGLPKKQYIQGSGDQFDMHYKVETKFNRAILYPSNILHSGLISHWQATDIASSRLTANTLIRIT